MAHFTHFFNPIAAPPDPDLEAAQRVAIRSMRLSAERAADAGIEVKLVTAQFREDRFLDAPFVATPDLTRHVGDLGEFAHPRKLPLLADLFDRAFRASDAPVLIYTNADIGLAPEFYVELANLDLDACSITRRTIPDELCDSDDPVRLAELARTVGLPHLGHDCFVFRRELLEGVDLGTLCIGFPPFGRVLVALLSSFAKPARFSVLRNEALTFHVGNAQPWQHARYLDYWRHNQRAALDVLDRADRARGLSETARQIRDDVARQEEL